MIDDSIVLPYLELFDHFDQYSEILLARFAGNLNI